jgi:2-polyprenyl-3-methyl-5-hydroxy-6-metoxy-1,4-benzoquinol methylase
MNMRDSFDFQCSICSGTHCSEVPSFSRLAKVSSDARACHFGGTLVTCNTCGAIRKVTDPAWRSAIDEIYRSYDIYFQAAGGEPHIHTSTGPVPRSRALLERLARSVDLPQRGRLLDIGCGNGAFLKSASTILPGWKLSGTELNNRYREQILAIPGVTTFHSGPLSDLDGQFDVIVLSHVLEHIETADAFLIEVAGLLAPDGILFIQVPNIAENPFDLLIVDHCHHFRPTELQWMAGRVGLESLIAAEDWAPKELTLVARRGVQPASAAPPHGNSGLAKAHVDWLHRLAQIARQQQQDSPQGIGILGTSIAATWLFQELPTPPGFFVDEDPNRQGKTYLGCPVLSTADAPPGRPVILPMPPRIAAALAQRLDGRLNAVLPPVATLVP